VAKASDWSQAITPFGRAPWNVLPIADRSRRVVITALLPLQWGRIDPPQGVSMPALEYLRAYLLNLVFFLIAIAIYVLAVPALPGQIAGLVLLSLVLTWLRVRRLRQVAVDLDFRDEQVFLAALQGALSGRRWAHTRLGDGHDCYEARVRLGLYSFTCRLDVLVTYEQATLSGHAHCVQPLAADLDRPGVAHRAPRVSPR
jgi:hypothetical protein